MRLPSVDIDRLFEAARTAGLHVHGMISAAIDYFRSFVSRVVLPMFRRDRALDYPALRAGLGGEWPETDAALPRFPGAEPLTGEEAWSLATRPIVDACATADHAAGLQSAAAEQVDAAVYALERLMSDLSGVLQPAQMRTAVVARVTFEAPRDRHAVSLRRTGLMPVRRGRVSRAA